MKLLVVTLLALSLSSISRGDPPLHRIILKSGNSFEIVSSSAMEPIMVYPVTTRIKAALRESMRPRIEAADHASEFTIRTKEPQRAIHELLFQISTQTGRQLIVAPSYRKQSSTNVTLAAADKDSVWFLALIPSDQEMFVVTCIYLIDEPEKG